MVEQPTPSILSEKTTEAPAAAMTQEMHNAHPSPDLHNNHYAPQIPPHGTSVTNLSLHTFNTTSAILPSDRTFRRTPKRPSHHILVKDFTLGFADGVTMPFALTAGLSILGNSRIVIFAGLAELFSGAVSMGLGAYLAARSDRYHYANALEREAGAVRDDPSREEEGVYDCLAVYGVGRAEARPVVEALKRDEGAWVQVCNFPYSPVACSLAPC